MTWLDKMYLNRLAEAKKVYDGLLTYKQAMRMTEVLVWAGKQENSPIKVEETKELARHLYYRSSTKPKEEEQ